MPTHLQKEIDNLKERLLKLSSAVEKRFLDAIQAIQTRDAQLARRVAEGDAEIDAAEVDLEEECLRVLALHQPVAVDLRFIVAVLRINSDIERIGDLAVNIAEAAIELCVGAPIPFPPHVLEMAERTKNVLRSALDAFVTFDATNARAVLNMDDTIDELHRKSFAYVESEIPRDLDHMPQYIRHLSVSRYLERIADHAANIAEDVIYLQRGAIVRHKELGKETD